jgi:hypothetical protein
MTSEVQRLMARIVPAAYLQPFVFSIPARAEEFPGARLRRLGHTFSIARRPTREAMKRLEAGATRAHPCAGAAYPPSAIR